MQDFIMQLKSGKSLSFSQVEDVVELLLSEGVADAEKADFLKALREKGETAEEIASFVQSLLKRAVNPEVNAAELDGPLLDVCGTGGDKADLFNISTTSMFVLAAGGAVVVKHGNRGITSKSGGADVLEQLGVRIDLPPAAFREAIKRFGAGFLFAPQYHPAFKVIAPVRKQLATEGVTTIFNMLGPLLNPVRPSRQLVGIFSRNLLPKYAEALQNLGRQHAWAVHGTLEADQGIDEISTIGPTEVWRVREGSAIESFHVSPGAFGFQNATAANLKGGDKERNASILLGILDGSFKDAKRDMVVLNAAAGFVVADLASSLEEGIALAKEQIDSGRALEKLRALQSFSA